MARNPRQPDLNSFFSLNGLFYASSQLMKRIETFLNVK